jgi:DNA-binding response OmpR family regulator
MMAGRLSQPENINVLISDANWAWPQAVTEIFQPRGINALLADSAEDMVRIVANNKIHLAIVDMVLDNLSVVQTLKMIRKQDQLVPCILLAQQVDNHLLADALALNAFSVLLKPVDLRLLAGQIHRLFLKYYASDVFAGIASEYPARPAAPPQRVSHRVSTIIRWTIRRNERSNYEHEDQTPGR